MFLKTLEIFTGVLALVYEGQHSLKFELGRAKKVVGPGLHFKWPIIQTFKTKETKDTTLDLEPQIIQLRDGLVFEVDAKLIYQIVDLKKALIEVDDLVKGLKNRVTMSVQRVVKSRDRESIKDMDGMIRAVVEELRPVEEQWGVKIHEFGFSNFAPTPATLEITQLAMLAEEKLRLYRSFRERESLSEEAAVSLVSGAVVTLGQRDESSLKLRRDEEKERERREQEELDRMMGEMASEDETGDQPDEL